MLAYGLSFLLPDASRDGAAVPGYVCAEWALSRLLMVPGFFEERTAEAIAILISGGSMSCFLRP